MCGVIAVIQANCSNTHAAVEIHDALYLLQHRGQDACGITVCGAGGRVFQVKGNGIASRVFADGARVSELPGYMGLGHLRYPTAGSSLHKEAQPMYVNSPYGILLAHNGNLINPRELSEYLDQHAHRHINTDNDSELVLNVFAHELDATGKSRVNSQDCFKALEGLYKKCQGAWACTAMIAGYGVVGFRDPYGIRPLVMGHKPSADGSGMDYMMASESVALVQCGYRNIIDILPGSAVIIPKNSAPVFAQVHPQMAYAPDIFEFVYFARPDTIIDGIDVDESRRNMGFKLAETIKQQLSASELAEIDVVMPIPETSATSAVCVAESLGKEYSLGFIKNRYIFRTFIMPNQQQRQRGVRAKLNPMRKKFEGKNVLLVDDSIVRGTTSREIVTMAREAGAKKVYFTSCSPPLMHMHIYGIDLASPSELIAHDRNSREIAQIIGADGVIYQKLEDLVAACASLSPRDPLVQQFEVGVFNGEYVTPMTPALSQELFDRGKERSHQKKLAVPDRGAEYINNGHDAYEETNLS